VLVLAMSCGNGNDCGGVGSLCPFANATYHATVTGTVTNESQTLLDSAIVIVRVPCQKAPCGTVGAVSDSTGRYSTELQLFPADGNWAGSTQLTTWVIVTLPPSKYGLPSTDSTRATLTYGPIGQPAPTNTVNLTVHTL